MGLFDLFQTNKKEKPSIWGLSLLKPKGSDEVLILGCDDGRNVLTLLETYPTANVTGAEGIVKQPEEKGRYRIVQENFADMSFATKSFDIACAFDSIYFWPDIDKCFREIYRVLKKGGSFIICNETDGKDLSGRSYQMMIQNMKAYQIDEIEKQLKKAGFKNIQSYHHETKPWITLIGEKQ